MAANAEIYFEHDRWGRALAWSAGLHVGITAFLLIFVAAVIDAREQGFAVALDRTGRADGMGQLNNLLRSTTTMPTVLQRSALCPSQEVGLKSRFRTDVCCQSWPCTFP